MSAFLLTFFIIYYKILYNIICNCKTKVLQFPNIAKKENKT